MPEAVAYSKLTEKQRKVFDIYVICRSVNAVANELEWPWRVTSNVIKSVRFQAAVKEHNESIKNQMLYNEAVIIDRMWALYSDEATPANVKAQLLQNLGKHVGMFGVNAKAEAAALTRPPTTFNIINYAEAGEPLEKVVEKAVEEADSAVKGFEITSFA